MAKRKHGEDKRRKRKWNVLVERHVPEEEKVMRSLDGRSTLGLRACGPDCAVCKKEGRKFGR